jgi:hypothetical protein
MRIKQLLESSRESIINSPICHFSSKYQNGVNRGRSEEVFLETELY